MQAHLSLVAPNATALGALGGDYGVTWPQRIVVDMGATKSGNTWVPDVRTITAEYSRQARVLGHQTDVTSANLPAHVTQANYQAMITGLNNLGDPGGAVNFYSLAAVVAHESQHAVRCRQALDDNRNRIEQAIKAVTVPLAAAATEALAVTAIQALPGYATAVQNAFTWWEASFDNYIANDHAGHGPCETAERRVVAPLVLQIQAIALSHRWGAPPVQVGLPVGSLGVAAARLSGGWH